MKKATALLVAGVGAAVYFLDPAQGRRRRALIRDKATHARHKLQDAVRTASTDVRNRAQGYRARVTSRLQSDVPSDDVLRERVRAAIGHVTTHPSAIDVSVNDGTVTLTGPILHEEVPLLIDRVLDVRGVRDLINRLEIHDDSGRLPALQGSNERVGVGARRRLFQNWPPAARLASGVAGAAAAGYGMAGQGVARKAIGAAGLALAARAATNRQWRDLLPFSRRRPRVKVRKTIHINAPVERVFELWTQADSFPHFMTHVREVRRLDGAGDPGRWHWKVQGKSGLAFEFNSRFTGLEQNRFIAWRSEPGSPIQHAGSARFLAQADGSTTVDVDMSYQPVAGAIGHAIAKLLGDDPKRQLDDDLLRMKSYIETGVAPHDAAAAAPRPSL